MTRRSLLLCSAPAALALAALVWVLARDGRCEAERRAERVREGMTVEEAWEALGGPGGASPEVHCDLFPWLFRPYPDGSQVEVHFRIEGKTCRVDRKSATFPPPWHQRLRDRLRQLGLPV